MGRPQQVTDTDAIIADASEHGPFATDLHGYDGRPPLEAQPQTDTNAAFALTQLGHWDSDFVGFSFGEGHFKSTRLTKITGCVL